MEKLNNITAVLFSKRFSFVVSYSNIIAACVLSATPNFIDFFPWDSRSGPLLFAPLRV